MEPMLEQENASETEAPAQSLALIWEELPAEKRREALQALALLLVRGAKAGSKDEQPE